MDAALERALVADFLNVFRYRRDDSDRFPIGYGIDCGDGWEPIVRRASAQLEALGLPVWQVKEKLGSLRIYVVDACPADQVLEVLRAAREESQRTCEDCGGAGILRNGSRWGTLCASCFAIRSRSS